MARILTAKDKIEKIEEKKELLKREEIRTMQKDIARLREGKSQGERERIAGLKIQEEKKRQTMEQLKKDKEGRKEEERKKREEGRIRGEKEKREEENKAKELKNELLVLKNNLSTLSQKKKSLDSQRGELVLKAAKVKENLPLVLEKERVIEEREKAIEVKEREARIPDEKKEIEKERWQIEEERRKVESERWKGEELEKTAENQLKEINSKHQDFLEEEQKIKVKIGEITSSLESLGKRMLKEGELKPFERKEETIEERFEKFKKKKEEKIKPPLPKEVPKTTLIPRPRKKPSAFRKIFIRLIVALIIFLIIGFLYWFFVIKKAEPPPEEPPITNGEEEENGEIEPPEIVIPPSLIEVSLTETLEISAIGEIPQSLFQILEKEFEEDSFVRILIKDREKNQILGLKEFFQAFAVKTPEESLSKLNNDFTLFIYSSEGVNRLGFLTKVEEKKNLTELLNSWEITIEKDTENLFLALGKTGPALTPYFRQTVFEGKPFRFLTISKADFGICYAIVDDYFIFTTSFASMEALMKKLEAMKPKERIGQLFLIGFSGKTLTPQLEEMIKKYQPGGVLLLSKNIETKEQLKNLVTNLQAFSIKEIGLPLFIAVDQEGDPISRIGFLEEKTSQSEIKNSQEAYQIGLKRGEELKEIGVNLNLAPLLDLMVRNDFYYNRSFQKSAEEVGELAKALILGQKEAGIFTAIKHFPGYIGIPFNPEEYLVVLEKTPEISQFKKAMEANPEIVMTANAIYKDIDSSLPFAFSSPAIQYLKNNLGEESLIVSDDLSQNSLLKIFSLKELVTKPIEAGVDILIFSGWRSSVEEALKTFYQAYNQGEVSKTKVEAAVSKIIKLKQELIK